MEGPGVAVRYNRHDLFQGCRQPVRPNHKFAQTLRAYRSGILTWYDYRISTGPLEGTNNKIKTMKRQAYGFRDPEFFKLKILAIQRWRSRGDILWGMKLGVFGGTFDPIHIGHLILAEQCRDACRLDHVLFVPAGTPPHKSGRRITPAKLRREMVELAIAGNPAFGVSSIELDRDGPSYSADTLAELARLHRDAELFFLIGADSLLDLPNWYQPARVLSLATLVVATRPGSVLPELGPVHSALQNARGDSAGWQIVEIPAVHVASSAVRERVAAGQTIRYLVPRAVECFIEAQTLYTT
jgi:nicotinate-nucleotide adenylyltransferase